MFFYDNQLELDEINQLPVNHVSAIKFCDRSNAWVGCQDGGLYRIDLNGMNANLCLSNDHIVADLHSTDNYLFCLSKNSVQLFNFEQQSSNELSSQRIKLGARSALNTMCKLSTTDQYLLGGCQSELYLFDVEKMSVVQKIPLFESPSSCIKIKRFETKNLIVTASVGGRITIYNQTTLRPILTYKPFKMSVFDFDLVNENFIISTGFDSSYSSQSSKNINIFDLRTFSELMLVDQSRFYRAHYVKGLTASKYYLTLNKDGIGEVNVIEDMKSFQTNGRRFSVELQVNATICASELSSDGNILLTADKNGFFHATSLNAPGGCSTKHVQINDIAHNSTDMDCGELSSFHDYYDTKRNFKIRSQFFLNQNLNQNDELDDTLTEITFSRCMNH